MNPLSKLVQWVGRKAASLYSQTGPFSTTSPELMRALGNPTTSGKAVTEDSTLGLSTAWSCIRIIAETIGSLPWALYERVGPNSVKESPQHPLASVLMGTPNPDQTHVEFRETLATALAGCGNAYSRKVMLGEEVAGLIPLRARECLPMRKRGSNTRLTLRDGEAFYRLQTANGPEDVLRENIWHIKGFGNDPLMGLSPIGVVREALGFDLAAEEFGSRFFANGGQPGGTASVTGWLNKDQRAIARENLQQLMGGLSQMHRFALFEGGMKPEPWNQMSLEDMAYIATRKFNVAQLCRIWRIPLHMVAQLEGGATFASVESMSREFVQFALMPYLTRMEASVSRWLLRPADRQRYFVRFKYEGLLRADTAARKDFYNSALQNGYLTRNEVRELENWNRADGLDGFTAQLNLAPVDKLEALADARIEAGGKASEPPAATQP